ncbi:MAG: xanthine dehydrogenase family protein subunit M, partial [Acidimicrobiia bacterium]|nr:xanthine dehydrogenase family protein subunit M [Acidimicrobiia bacterium]
DEAWSLLGDGGGSAKVLAGGQSLVPMLKLRFASPEMLVDINGLPDLAYHRRDADGSIHIGALARHAHLERSSVLAEYQPTMAACARLVADPVVRNRGTLVGSLCHAYPQGDWASVMLSLDGYVVALSPRGRRTIAVRDFVNGPFQNALAYDEIAIEAVVPTPKGTPAGGYLKLERRVGDFATAGVAVSVDRVGGSVVRAGIALTGVGASTIPADEAAGILVGSALSADRIAEAADLAASVAEPNSDHRGSADYKRHLIRVFTSRILTQLLDTAEEAA